MHLIAGSQEEICCASTPSCTVQLGSRSFKMRFGPPGKVMCPGDRAGISCWGGGKDPVFSFLAPNGSCCCCSAALASLAFSGGAACPVGPAAAAEPELFSSSRARLLMEQARTRQQDGPWHRDDVGAAPELLLAGCCCHELSSNRSRALAPCPGKHLSKKKKKEKKAINNSLCLKTSLSTLRGKKT